MDMETDESETGSELSLRLWQHHDAAPARRLDGASSATPVHHVPRHHEAHGWYRPERHQRLPQPGETAKRLFDIVGALTLAVELSPLLLALGMALSRDHG